MLNASVVAHGVTRPRASLALWVCGVVGLVLLAGLALQFTYTIRQIPRAKPRDRLSVLVSASSDEWVARDEPLGATEAVNEATLKTLNLDDYVYRRFSRGGKTFTVYAAYWGPGRMPTRLVASHTPDRCWTENGMRCVDMRFRETFTVERQTLLPAEYRVFTPSTTAQRTYVVYWHTVEGKLYDYGGRFNAVPHPWLWWKDTVAQAMQGSHEQFFVRVASETPFEELWTEPGFLEVMRKVADLGLWETPR